jgi:hypothetical protein
MEIEPGYCEPDYWIGITLMNQVGGPGLILPHHRDARQHSGSVLGTVGFLGIAQNLPSAHQPTIW